MLTAITQGHNVAPSSERLQRSLMSDIAMKDQNPRVFDAPKFMETLHLYIGCHVKQPGHQLQTNKHAYIHK